MVSVERTSPRQIAFTDESAHHFKVEENIGVGFITNIDIGSTLDKPAKGSSTAIAATECISEASVLAWLKAQGFHFNPFAQSDGGLDSHLHCYNFSNKSPLEQNQPHLAVHEARVVLGTPGSGKTTKMLRIQNDLNRSFPKTLGVQFTLTWDLVEAPRADAWTQAMAMITKSVARASLALSTLPIVDPNTAHKQLDWNDAQLAHWVNLLDSGIGRLTWLAEVKDALQRQSTELLFQLAALDYTYRDLQSNQVDGDQLILLHRLVDQADRVPAPTQVNVAEDDAEAIPVSWRVLREFCNACQLEHLVIMVNDFSKHFGKQTGKALAALDSIVARMFKDQALGKQLSVQCFFDSQTEVQLGKTLKRLPVYRLGWSESDLHKLIKRRLIAARSSANATWPQITRHTSETAGLAEFFGTAQNLDGDSSDLESSFVAQSNLSPQRLIRLINDQLHTVVQQGLLANESK